MTEIDPEDYGYSGMVLGLAMALAFVVGFIVAWKWF